MKVFKPNDLALLYRAYTFAGRNTLSLGMLAMFSFEGGGRDRLAQEPQLWEAATQALAAAGIEAPLDEGWSKPASEFMLYGAAFAPNAGNGGQVAQIAVNAKVGGVAKQLYVFGDREFGLAGLLTQARPFSRMSLGPAQAFGGAGFNDNPSGKGFMETARAEGGMRRSLPNVEHPRQLMAAAGDKPAPAGFGALAPDHSLRKAHLGKFDQRWLEQSWPHLPDETRLDYFMAAPPDQRMSGYLRGDERFELENLHPARARIVGQLPGLRARCFIHRKLADGQEEFSELEARAETVWLLPEQGCGIVLYRASAQTLDSDADDVLHALLEWEMQTDPALPFAHYEASFRRQIAAAQPAPPAEAPPLPAIAEPAAAASLPAIPVAAAAAPAALALDPELLALEKLSADLQAQTDALLRKHGLTQADIIRPPTEPPETTLAEIDALTKKMEADTKALLGQHGLSEADIIRPPSEAPETSLAQLQAVTAKMEAEKTALMQKHGVTDAQIQAHLAQQGQSDAAQFMSDAPLALAQQQAALDATQAAIAALPALAVTPKLPPAPELPKLPGLPALPDDEPAPRLTREQVVERHQRGASFQGMDLSGLDLSELDLSGAVFTDALLTKTAFQKSQLSGARFDGALLQTADFSGADLSGAVLAGVSAGQAVFAAARMAGSDLSKGDFTGGDFAAAQLQRANLAESIFNDAGMDGLQAAGCHAPQASFNGCALAQADFSGAQLSAARFNGAQCVQANLAGSLCDRTEFHAADFSGARFDQASMTASRASAGSRFDGASFTAAQLNRASWEGASAGKARFDDARMDDADFSKVQAAGAVFAGASAKGAKFAKADLSHADLTAINLFKGSLRKSRVDGALLQFANLFGVDFEGTRPTRAALEGADIGQTSLQFRPPA